MEVDVPPPRERPWYDPQAVLNAQPVMVAVIDIVEDDEDVIVIGDMLRARGYRSQDSPDPMHMVLTMS